MKQIFISYSRKNLHFVEKIAQDLEGEGFDIWYDLTDIEAGDRWAQEIENAIDESDIFVIIVTPDSIKSQWVEKEFLYASRRGMKIVPLLLEHYKLPLWLLNIHYIDIMGRNYKKNFQQVLNALNDSGRRNGDRQGNEPNKVVGGSKIPWIIGGVIGVAAVLAAIFWPDHPITPPEPTEAPILEATIAPMTETETPIPTETEAPQVFTATATIVPLTATPLPNEIVTEKGAEMVLIPAGSFLMGNDAGEDDEKPVHQVVLDNFYIDKYEVTNAQYKACADEANSPCVLPTKREAYLNSQYSNYPVVYVKWDMAVAYCKWRGARLPTEAEWEKAARDGKYADYPWGDASVDGRKLNFCDMNCQYDWADKRINDKYTGISPVGNYEGGMTDSGVYDLAGNVWEWVADWYFSGYYPDSPISNPLGPDTGVYRVLRGGSWYNSESSVHVYERYQLNPATNNDTIGFRCAIDVTP